MMMNHAIGKLIVGAILIGFAPILAKLSGLPAGWMAAYRCLISSGLLLLIVLVQEKLNVRSLFSRGWPLLLIPGAFFGFDMFVWHHSIVMAGAGLSTILANTQIFYLMVIGYLIFGERLPWQFLVATALTLGGVLILVQPAGETLSENNYWLGVVFGAFTGFLYAGFTTSLRLTGEQLVGTKSGDSIFIRLFWVCLTAGIMAVFGEVIVFSSDFVVPSAEGWGWIFLLALFPQILGWWLITSSLSEIPISKAGLILLIQPLVATLFGAILFHEPLTPLRVVGGVFALYGIYLGGKVHHLQSRSMPSR